MPLPNFLHVPLPFTCPISGWSALPAWLISLGTLMLGIGSVAMALIAEHIFGLAPCILCLYQRVPYALIAIIGFVSLMFLDNRRGYQACMILLALTMLAGGIIGAFQSGVEFGWWTFQRDCGAGFDPTASVDQFLAQIQSAPTVRCDEPSWWFLGLTMASWNALFSFTAAGAYGSIAWLIKK